jgi:SAM-dependent methyltransferase
MDLRDTDSDWSKLSLDDPFWAVLSSEEYRGKELSADQLRAFFETGERDVAQLFGFIKRHLLTDFRPKRSLDFGCGVGRLLFPIARLSGDAVGVDVAAGMLDLCRRFAAEHGLDNITLIQNDDRLSDVSGEFDFISTYIVLQHIPPERGYYLLERLMQLLRIGGVGSIHVTYAKHRRFLVHEGRHAKFYRREGTVIHDVGPTPDHQPVGSITMFDYDLNQVMVIISQYAGHPIMVLPTDHNDHLGTHFVFQRAR